ncbi:MAG: hypothetical protein WB973_04625 [Thermoanaerobaculia bacterium]
MKILSATLLLLVAGTALASQPLETETARPLPQGVFKIELTGEFQTSRPAVKHQR